MSTVARFMTLIENRDRPLAVFTEELAAEGYSYREMLLITWWFVTLWILVCFIFLDITFYFVWRWYIRRETTTRHDPMEKFLFYATNTCLLFTFLCVPFFFSFAVALDYMNVWISIVLGFFIAAKGWTIVCPPGLLSIQRDKYLPFLPNSLVDDKYAAVSTLSPGDSSSSSAAASSLSPTIVTGLSLPVQNMITRVSSYPNVHNPSSSPSNYVRLPSPRGATPAAPAPFRSHQRSSSAIIPTTMLPTLVLASPTMPIVTTTTPTTVASTTPSPRGGNGGGRYRTHHRSSSLVIPTFTINPVPGTVPISQLIHPETNNNSPPSSKDSPKCPPKLDGNSENYVVSITCPPNNINNTNSSRRKGKLVRWDRRSRKSSGCATWKRFLRKPIERPWWFWTGLMFCFLFVFCSNFFFEDVCIATEPFELSFKWSRMRTPSMCQIGAPCHVYLTFGDQMETSIIVNFHTRQPMKNPKVYFDTKSHSGGSLSEYRFLEFRGTTVKMDFEEDRYVHWVELHGLKANTRYYFRAGGDDNKEENSSVEQENEEWYSSERWFLTAPSEEGSEGFVYASGGDMGISSHARKLVHLARDRDPLFIALGGDIAYETGFRACYRRFDDWLRLYDLSSSKEGRMVPVLPTIGNHEGGFLLKDRQDLPFYFDYFPMEYGKVHPNERSSFHLHLFGKNTVFLGLDSGHLSAPSHQIGFIEKSVMDHPERHNRIAFYHVPFESAADHDEDPDLRKMIRNSWSQVFEEQEITIAFQHHDHAYGRQHSPSSPPSEPTPPNSSDAPKVPSESIPDTSSSSSSSSSEKQQTRRAENNHEEKTRQKKGKGPLLVTAGCMGAGASPTTVKNKNDFEVLESLEHIVVVHVKNSEIAVEAVDMNGRVFDAFSVATTPVSSISSGKKSPKRRR